MKKENNIFSKNTYTILVIFYDITRRFFMEKNQKINCTVKSCAFNDNEYKLCQLEQIKVQPCKNCHNGNAEDESMCGSYRQNY